MAHPTLTLIKTEIRMLYNQFKITIRNPSMLIFYSITIFGVFFVSLVIAEIGRLGLMLEETLLVLEEVLDRSMIFAIFGLASLSSVLAGYFGVGPAELLIETDEYVILPALR